MPEKGNTLLDKSIKRTVSVYVNKVKSPDLVLGIGNIDINPLLLPLALFHLVCIRMYVLVCLYVCISMYICMYV
jgi:hypothetical protein